MTHKRIYISTLCIHFQEYDWLREYAAGPKITQQQLHDDIRRVARIMEENS